MKATTSSRADLSIWAFAFGYFACYVPYSALTKALSKGLLPGMNHASVSGFELLPPTVLASAVGMMIFLSVMGWWKYASHSRVFGIDLPHPTRWTLLSGICTAAIIMTTTLAYTFKGVSIVFVMLLMRGGVLIIAPMVDALSGRHVRWFSWIGLALSMGSLFVAINGSAGYTISFLCGLDVALYLASYFVRLRFMSRLAKSSDGNANRRFFVEEQLVASPLLLLVLAVLAALGGQGEILGGLHQGFTTFWSGPVVGTALLVGLLSQGTGIFGGLILLDARENTYCVPVNRCSSVLAGVGAAYTLSIWLGQAPPSGSELVGAGLITTAILFLTLPPMIEKRRKSPPMLANEGEVKHHSALATGR